MNARNRSALHTGGSRDTRGVSHGGHVRAVAAVPGLQPPDAFRAEIEREMDRADRSETPLSLLLFDVSGLEQGSGEYHERLIDLARAACRRTRLTDGVGWLLDDDGLRVGMILHQTGAEKAYHVISGVRAEFRRELRAHRYPEGAAPDVSCEIYAYPGQERGHDGVKKPRQLSLFGSEDFADSERAHASRAGENAERGARRDGAKPSENGADAPVLHQDPESSFA